MYRTVCINIIRALAGIVCIRIGGLIPDLLVFLLSAQSLAFGCYELKHSEEISAFKDRPGYYSNFVIGFDMLFPVALIALWFANRIGS